MARSVAKVVGRVPEFWLGGNETKTVTLRIRSGEKPADKRLTARVVSTRGRIAEREMRW